MKNSSQLLRNSIPTVSHLNVKNQMTEVLVLKVSSVVMESVLMRKLVAAQMVNTGVLRLNNA